ncbi:AAA family ATPase [Vibrio hippocampi]|uniref:AAA+ ATPase domain-containing protein n=1 Tax=Vibrio hippocampi TaxID=654686 RepID=A0ABM8ZN73_9VIBR|nr:AAA family ATPase [Vibrio hippocampi]CAH0530006.1 hypothetical protein VHP8226_03732 [Vibrio hippocampi]
MDDLIDFSDNLSVESLYKKFDEKGKSLIEELILVATAEYLSHECNSTIERIRNSKSITLEVGLEHLFSAILSNVEILSALAERLKSQTYQLAFSAKAYQLRENILQVAEKRSYGDPSTTWFQDAHSLIPKLSLSHDLERLFWESLVSNQLKTDKLVENLLASKSREVDAFLHLNPVTNNLVTRAKISERINIELTGSVIGQQKAIEQLCYGYLASSLQAQQGPRLIYTFVGPSGVGKTYLAKQFAKQLQQYEHSGYHFNVFNMEHYQDKRDALKLFGSGSQYADANLGALTRIVRSNPRQILLFDEIEKAHASVVQSLLSVLDSGNAKDQTSQDDVDFSQCIIIFTTNLGHDVISHATQGKTVSVFDILKTSTNPTNQLQLSHEFVNRLAKGYPIIFGDLQPNHLIKIAEMELANHAIKSGQASFHWQC